MQFARLENWYVGANDLLYGEVYDHPKFNDGDPIVTSRVVRFDKETLQAVTMNTNYVLGKERIFNSKKGDLK